MEGVSARIKRDSLQRNAAAPSTYLHSGAKVNDREQRDDELAEHDHRLPRGDEAAACRRVAGEEEAERAVCSGVAVCDRLSESPDQDKGAERDAERVDGGENDAKANVPIVLLCEALFRVVLDEVVLPVDRFAAAHHADGGSDERRVQREEDEDEHGGCVNGGGEDGGVGGGRR